MEMKKLDKNALIYWYLSHTFLTLLIWIPFILVGILAPADTAKIVLLIVLGLVDAALSALLLVWPRLKYDRYTYGYDDLNIYVSFGVIFRHRIKIPVCQIQDLHITQPPVARLLKLSSVTFSTAGSNFTLPCVNFSEAEVMVDTIDKLLIKRIEEKTNEKV